MSNLNIKTQINTYICKNCNQSFYCDERVECCCDFCAENESKKSGSSSAPDYAQIYYVKCRNIIKLANKDLLSLKESFYSESKTNKTGLFSDLYSWFSGLDPFNPVNYFGLPLNIVKPHNRIKLRKRSLYLLTCKFENCNKYFLHKTTRKTFCNPKCCTGQSRLRKQRLDGIDSYEFIDKRYDDLKEKELIEKSRNMNTSELIKEFGNLK